MSSQILDKSMSQEPAVDDYSHLSVVEQMSTRVDALEASIYDIINGDVTVLQSPS